MSNAKLTYESLNSYSDIQNLIGKQENFYTDFKVTFSNNGRMNEDDKRNFSKAASGFAHQEGGVIIWGIACREDIDKVDNVIGLQPIKKVKIFKQEMESYIKDATEPVLDGILNKVIFLNDNESLEEGFVISFFPKSNFVHMALGKNKHDFYKRHGDGFVSLTTTEIRSLFMRILEPDLQFIVEPNWKFGLKNVGNGVAKFCSLYIGIEGTRPNNVGWYDETGNYQYKFGILANSAMVGYEKHFIVGSDIVIHPGQQLILCSFSVTETNPTATFRYKIFAENMMPKEGVLKS